MSHSGDPLQRVEALQCPNCQQSAVICTTPATPTSRAIFQCQQCKTYVDQTAPQHQPAPNNVLIPQHILDGMMQTMTTVKDLTAKVDKMQTLMDENVALKQRLEEQEKELTELRNRLHQQQAAQEKQKAPKTGVNPPLRPVQPVSVTSAASAPKPANSYADVSRRFRPTQVRTAKSEAACARYFAEDTGPQGYEYVYLPSRHRSTEKTTRQKLRGIGVETSRILDINFPARGTVALLVHVQYRPDLLELLNSLGIKPKHDFDPLHPDHLNDPKFDGLSNTAREIAMGGIHNTRMLRALTHIGASRAYSVGRSFVEKGWITEEDLLQKAREWDNRRKSKPSEHVDRMDESEPEL